MGKKGRAALFFIFVFALMMIFLIYWMNSLTLVRHVAIVDSVQGKVEVLVHGKGAPHTPKVGRLVQAGDIIRTGPDSSIEIRWVRWAGGMRIKIGPNTKFTVKRADLNSSTREEESRLRVDTGKIWVRIRQSLTGKSKFEVETPTVVAAVRGTIFSVAVAADGSSRVEVLEGKVALSPTLGGVETVVSPGQASQIADSPKSEAALQPMSAQEKADWQQQTSIVGPFLEVSAPLEGAAIAGGEGLVSGRTEPGAKLFINNSPATLDKKGHFSHNFALEPQADSITIRARDEQGRESVIIRNIIRGAAQPQAAENPPASPEPAPPTEKSQPDSNN
jgi:hypothetical protein